MVERHDTETEARVQARIEALIEAERGQPLLYWYLSFVDPDAPQGRRFKGAIITEAPGYTTALRKTHKLRINPGGEVMGTPMPCACLPELVDRLLTMSELQAAFGTMVDMEGREYRG